MYDTISMYVDGESVEVQVSCFGGQGAQYFINATGQLYRVTASSARLVASPPKEIPALVAGEQQFLIFRSGSFQGLRRPDELVRLMCPMCGHTLYAADGRFHDCRRV